MTIDRASVAEGARLAAEAMRPGPITAVVTFHDHVTPEHYAELARDWLAVQDLLALIGADTTAADLAQEVEFLKAELTQLRDENDRLLRQRWSHENRAEVAERGHKAALAREEPREQELRRLKRVEEAARRLPKPLRNGNMTLVDDRVLEPIEAALANPAAEEGE